MITLCSLAALLFSFVSYVASQRALQRNSPVVWQLLDFSSDALGIGGIGGLVYVLGVLCIRWLP